MNIEEFLDYLDDIKYDLVPDEEIELSSDDGISFYLWWHTPSLNLNYYPIVQVSDNGEEIFWREGTENPDNWYRVVDQAIEAISKLYDFEPDSPSTDKYEEDYDPNSYGQHSEDWYIARDHGEDTEPFT